MQSYVRSLSARAGYGALAVLAALSVVLPATGAEASGKKGDAVILFVLRSTGLEPRRIQIAPGPAAIRIINRSGMDNVRISVAKQGTGGAAEDKFEDSPRRESKWSIKRSFNEGTFVLQVANAPWAGAEIVVSAKK